MNECYLVLAWVIKFHHVAYYWHRMSMLILLLLSSFANILWDGKIIFCETGHLISTRLFSHIFSKLWNKKILIWLKIVWWHGDINGYFCQSKWIWVTCKHLAQIVYNLNIFCLYFNYFSHGPVNFPPPPSRRSCSSPCNQVRPKTIGYSRHISIFDSKWQKKGEVDGLITDSECDGPSHGKQLKISHALKN